MKITKELEAEIRVMMDDYWDSYFRGDLEHWENYLVDDYRNIGGTEEEIWNSKQEIVEYTHRVIDQMMGLTEIRNKQMQIIPYDGYLMVHEFLDIFIKIEKNWTFYGKFRLSTLIQKIAGVWKVLHQHGSYPDSHTEQGEAFAFDTLRKENTQLREAVKRRTIELEQKTQDLLLEAALEKVRSSALAMNEPADMVEVCRVISDQLLQLGVTDIRNVQTAIINEQKGTYLNYQYFAAYKEGVIEETDYNLHPTSYAMAQEMKKSAHTTFSGSMEGLELNTFREWRKQNSQFPDPLLDEVDSAHYYFYSIGQGGLGLSTYKSLSEEGLEIFKRFHNVFTLAYRRFMDIQLAEAQAREAQIEAAVERVRAQSMAMHHPDDLDKVNKEILTQLNSLRIQGLSGVTFYLVDHDGWVKAWDFSSPGNMGDLNSYTLQFDFTRYELMGEPFKTFRQTDLNYFVADYPLEKLERAVFELEEINPAVADVFKEALAKGILTHQWTACARIADGLLGVDLVSPPSEDTKTIVLKIAGAFNQAYQRFLDLQKAEAQAREAKIETALEKVRSRTMGMQRSDELQEVANLMFLEVQSLGIPSWSCGYNILSQDKKIATNFMSNEGTIQKPFDLPLTLEPSLLEFYHFLQSDTFFFTQELDGKAIENHYNFMKSLPELAPIFEGIEKAGISLPAYQINHLCKFTHGYLLFITYEQVADAHDIFKRFTRVFDQIYTRFLDIKKAEAQARESQIETALEKVRGVALSLQKSDEMLQVAQVLYEQLLELGFNNIRNAIIDINNGNTDTFTDYDYSHEMSGTITQMSYHDDPTLEGQFKKMATTTNDFFELILEGKELEDLKRMRLKNGEAPDDRIDNTDLLTYNLYSFGQGAIGISNFGVLSKEEKAVLSRFNNVFTFAYKRYSDMVQAEYQAREVQIELALERIRSQVTAMQESSGLLDIVVNMRREFVGLGHEAHYFWYMRWLPEKYEKAMTSGDGTRIGMIMSLPRHIHGDVKLVADWEKSNEPTVVFAMDKETAVDYVHKMITLGDFEQVDPQAPSLDDIRHIGGLTFIMARTTHGEIGFSLPGEVPHPPKEALDTLVRFAGVFDMAYQRFEDLQESEQQARLILEERDLLEVALKELHATQDQLIQQEKLASLGQLTAGIAHEIKNPLNFVNNFSEVSMELIEEVMEEIKTQGLASQQTITEILTDIQSNLSKIHEHGTRANGIVSSMLQHSRGGSGKKEPADLNALVKEYVNLAFHGMRAGKNPINVDIRLDLDEKISSVNLIGEDFSRVVLNLVNNAFDAMREKTKTDPGYKPTLSINTKQKENAVEVAITDNGPGIPGDIKDKILQPFFTTKKGTEGTGLGLSITHDIVKAHGGELEIETAINKGTNFKIKLNT